YFVFSSRRRHTRFSRDWSSDVCSSDLLVIIIGMVASMFLFVVPNLLLLIISSVSYGPVWGSLISLVAVFISSTVAYSLGYWVGRSEERRVGQVPGSATA